MDDPDFDFTLKVKTSTQTIEIPSNDMLIPGGLAGSNNDNCFFAVFRNPDPTGHWIFGLNVMHDYYVVFDATSKPLRTWFGKKAAKLTPGEEPEPVKPAVCNLWEKNDPTDVTKCVSKSESECTGAGLFWDTSACRAIRESDCPDDQELKEGVCVDKPKPSVCKPWEKNDPNDVTKCISKTQ